MRPSDACAATSAVFPLALRARGVSELGHDRDPPNAMYAGFSKRPLAADSDIGDDVVGGLMDGNDWDGWMLMGDAGVGFISGVMGMWIYGGVGVDDVDDGGGSWCMDGAMIVGGNGMFDLACRSMEVKPSWYPSTRMGMLISYDHIWMDDDGKDLKT
ncbi:unnamed protein product [Arctia plantaginis]|uniref:Uncharacterized protein n=1 Tax=Arctia plantaginis TaxID=874455 RepID=A0A8S0ZBR4_ARCPL|nr:unnamed protein product [Arctia plantaginis]